jgi:hypothetical protein
MTRCTTAEVCHTWLRMTILFLILRSVTKLFFVRCTVPSCSMSCRAISCHFQLSICRFVNSSTGGFVWVCDYSLSDGCRGGPVSRRQRELNVVGEMDKSNCRYLFNGGPGRIRVPCSRYLNSCLIVLTYHVQHPSVHAKAGPIPSTTGALSYYKVLLNYDWVWTWPWQARPLSWGAWRLLF